ncbi:MAG: flagellar hook-length control protein FliK, partial [Betaproteobacteria bacterium]
SRVAALVTELEGLQIEALPQSHGRESGLASILLFRDQSPVELLFERENVTEGDEVKRLWILNLHTWLEHLGEVWMKSVFSGKDVELTFWAREKQTAALANKSMMDLEEALSEQNLNVKSLQIFASPRPGFDKSWSGEVSNLDTKV